MDIPASRGDALSQPTRARLFALLGELRRPTSTDELARRLGLHPNGVRVHLERLETAGLVVRERERLARGRPRDRWSISPTALPGGERPTDYAGLGRSLVQAIAATDLGVREIEAAGRQIGRDLAPQDGARSPEERMHSVLVAAGFQPERQRGKAGELTYRLGNCPYRDVARERQPVVCALHRGMTRGLLDAIDPETELTGFVVKDPETAGCLIELRGPLAGDDAR